MASATTTPCSRRVRRVLRRATWETAVLLLAWWILWPPGVHAATVTSYTPTTREALSGTTTTGTFLVTITGSGFNATLSDTTAASGTTARTCAATYSQSGVPCTRIQVKTRTAATDTPTLKETIWLTSANSATISDSQITVSVKNSYLQKSGYIDLYIQDVETGNYANMPATITIVNPLPVLDSTAPLSLTSTEANPTTAPGIYVRGTGFTRNSVILWDATGTATEITPVFDTSVTPGCPAANAPCLQFALPTSLATTPGVYAIAVRNPASATGGGGTSGTATFTLTNPIPGIKTIAPTYVATGAATTTFTLTGGPFVTGATIRVSPSNNTYTPRTFTNLATTILVDITATEFQTARELTVSAKNPSPGGGEGASVSLYVLDATPTLTGVSPTSVAMGSTATTITLAGMNFDASAVATWNGTDLTTTWVSLTQIKATVPSTLLATPGVNTIGVRNATYNTTAPTTASLSVLYPTPTATTLSPSSIQAGTNPPVVTIEGAGFTRNTTVTWGGVTKPPTVYTSTLLSVTLDAQNVASAGTTSVTATNPTPGGGTSSTLTFTVTNGVPTLSAVTPSAALAGRAATTLTVTGAGFASTSTVLWDSTALATTYQSATTLTATVPASLLTTVGTTTSISVHTPAPGGGDSTTQLFRVLQAATLTVSDLQQVDSGTVAVSVTWTGATPTTSSVNCGNGTMLTSLPGTCTYTTATSYTLTGTYTLVGQTFTATPATVTVPAVQPVVTTLTPLVSGSIPATGTVQVYALPTTLSVPITFTAPTSVGVLDALDVSRSTVLLLLTGSAPRQLALASTGSLTYSTTSTPQLTSAGSYTVTLNAYTVSGQALTVSSSFTLALATMTLDVQSLIQSDASVLVPVYWPLTPTVTDQVVDCGTSPTQTFTGSSGICTYTAGGTYTIQGTFTDPNGLPKVATAAARVTIPWRPLTPAPLAPTVNGQAAATAQVYSFPATFDLALAFSATDGPGILDSLDLSTSRIAVSLLSGATTTYRLTATDSLHYQLAASGALTQAGSYTVTLSGQTTSGATVTATTSFTLSVAPITLLLDTPTQAGTAVTVAVRWPDTPAVTNHVTTCGASPTQTFTGASGTCTYTAAGTYTVSGTFTDPQNVPNVTTAASTVAIASRPLQLTRFTGTIDGQATATFTTYSTPLPMAFALSFTAADTVGVLDTLALGTSVIQVARDGLPLSPLSLTKTDDLTYTATASLTSRGAYTFALAAYAGTGQLYTASTQLTLTVGTVALLLDTPVQQDETVRIPIRWPDTPTFTNYQVDCGTTTAQTFTGTAGTCTYTKAGTYTVSGTFTDLRRVDNITTAPTTATVAAITPVLTSLTPTINGQAADHAAVYNYPTTVEFPLTFTRPADIGILDELDLTASTLTLSHTGVTSTRLSLTRTDGLHYTTATALTTSGTYTATLAGVTTTGQTISSTASFTLTLTPVTLLLDALTQADFAVAAAIHWPEAPVVTDMTVSCGTTTVQTFTGTAGTCTYTKAGTYTVSGTFTDPTGATHVSTAPLTVTVGTRTLTTPVLTAWLNSAPLGSQPIYLLPKTPTLTVTFTPSSDVGIVDALNLSPSRITVAKDGVQQSRHTLSHVDPITYTSSATLSSAGTYTFTFSGTSAAGVALSTTLTVTVAVTPVALTAGSLAQKDTAVISEISWLSDVTLANQTVSCGTTTVQTFTGTAGTCTYTKAGTYTVSGTFTDPMSTKTVTATSTTVTVPSVPASAATLALALNGYPATNARVSTTLPAVLDVSAALTPSTTVGILDPVATTTLALSGGASVTVALSASTDGAAFTGQTLLAAGGDYTAAFTATTSAKATLTATTTTTLVGTPVTLILGDFVQASTRLIQVPLTFPASLSGSKFKVDCGTAETQILSGQSVVCEYTTPDTFTAIGYYVPDGSTTRVQTADTTVTIPGFAPAYYLLDVTFPSAGTLTVSGTDDAREYLLAPTSYPVDIKVTVSPVAPANTPLGILTPFTEDSGTLHLTMLSTIDGTSVPETATTSLPLHDNSTTQTFSVRSTFRGFDIGTETQKISGTFRLTFTATLIDGAAVTQTAALTINEPDLQATVIPYGLEGPYAPATFRYRLTSSPSAVKHERMSATWTVTRVESGEVIKQSSGSTNFSYTFTTPGTYRIALTMVGSISGTYTWSEQITVPTPPTDPDLPLITYSSGGPQRPPVQYRLMTSYPTVEDGDRYTSIAWTLNGTATTRPVNRPTITTPGAHTFGVILTTKNGVVKTATQSIDVRANLSPRGTLDCSKTVQGTTTATLRCSGSGLDPDGRIKTRRWVVPELNIDSRGGWTLKSTVTDPPANVTVHLYVTDSSDQTEDLGPVDVQLRP